MIEIQVECNQIHRVLPACPQHDSLPSPRQERSIAAKVSGIYRHFLQGLLGFFQCLGVAFSSRVGQVLSLRMSRSSSSNL